MAELDVKERQAGDVTILDMNGEVRIGDGSVALRDAVRKLTADGKKKILLNLAGVSYIDSSGISWLIGRHKQFKQHAKSIEVTIDGTRMSAPVKEFSTGSLGWYLNGRMNVTIDGQQVVVLVENFQEWVIGGHARTKVRSRAGHIPT